MRAGVTWTLALVTALVSAVVGALFGPTLSDYFAIGQPDIRYTYNQLPEDQRLAVLDHLFDANGNSVVLVSIRLRIKNTAVKQGYIDRPSSCHSTFSPFPRSKFRALTSAP